MVLHGEKIARRDRRIGLAAEGTVCGNPLPIGGDTGVLRIRPTVGTGHRRPDNGPVTAGRLRRSPRAPRAGPGRSPRTQAPRARQPHQAGSRRMWGGISVLRYSSSSGVDTRPSISLRCGWRPRGVAGHGRLIQRRRAREGGRIGPSWGSLTPAADVWGMRLRRTGLVLVAFCPKRRIGEPP